MHIPNIAILCLYYLFLTHSLSISLGFFLLFFSPLFFLTYLYLAVFLYLIYVYIHEVFFFLTEKVIK